MNRYVGFVFTDGPLENLKSRGFSFHEDSREQDQGYRSYLIQFSNIDSLEIRKILDEELYIRKFQNEHFEPFGQTTAGSLTQKMHLTQPNTIYEFIKTITAADMDQIEIRSFFEIRKAYPLWALWLKCADYKKFCQVAKPDRIFNWNGIEMALIHMGPHCFDFLVSP